MSARRAGLTIGIVLATVALTGAQPRPTPADQPVLIKKNDKEDWLARILFSPDGRYLLTAGRTHVKKPFIRQLPNGLGTSQTGGLGIVRIWEVPRGTLVRTLEVQQGDLNGWAMNAAGDLLATGGEFENTVKLWEFPSGRLVHTIEGNNTPVRFSADGSRVWVSYRYSFSVGPRGVNFNPVDNWSVWDVQTGKLIAPIDRMLLSSDGRIGAVDVKDGVEIRNSVTGGVVGRLPVPWTNRRTLSTDGSRLAVARDTDDRVTVEVWNTLNGERLWADHGEHRLPEVVFSPNGATLIGYDQQAAAVSVWDTETGHRRSIEPSSRDREMQVRDAAFSADGSLLAVHRSSELKTDANPAAMPGKNSIGIVTFVRMPALEPAGEITLRPDVQAFVITRDAWSMATRERDGNVRLWRTPVSR